MEDFLHVDDPSCEGIPSASEGASPAVPAGSFHAVVIGGGTGTSVSIRALRAIGIAPDAVVAMADDGGSTGVLRKISDITPPGDIRKCLVALAENPAGPLAQAFAGRMKPIDDHALGNLILGALEQTCGSFPEAIAACEGILKTCGHVYPSTLEHVRLVAVNEDGAIIYGQHDANVSQSALKNVRLMSDGGVPSAYEPALQAIKQADFIVLGPGSFFTSVVPNLLIPGISEAIIESSATVVFVCSLADAQGETKGFSAIDYHDALVRFGLGNRIDFIIGQPIDPHADTVRLPSGEVVPVVQIDVREMQSIERFEGHVIVRDLPDERYPWRHDVVKLGSVFAEVINACHLPLM